MIRSSLPFLIGLSLAVSGSGCHKVEAAKHVAIRPESRKIVSTVKVVGTLKPIGLAEIHAPSDGVIEHVLVKKGDRVKKGDVLIEISKDEPERAVREATIKLRIATL